MPYTPQGPYRVDTAGSGSRWTHQLFGSCNYPGPHRRGNERYAVWTAPTSEATADLRVFRSADSGVTWVAQDVGSMPSMGNTIVATELLDSNTLRLCYGGTAPEVLATNVPVVRDFDLVTNTLGPILFTADAFILQAPQIAGYRRNVVAAQDWVFVMRASGFGIAITLYRHDGAGFLPEVQISDNVLLPNSKVCALEAIYMDPSGTAHVIYSERPRVAQKPRTVYYRQVSALGVMTAPAAVYTYNFISPQTFGFPDRLGTFLVFPFPKENGTSEADQYWTAAMLVIDPYTVPAPSTTLVDLPSQRLSLITTANSGSVHASTLGGQAYLWWLEELGLDGVTPLSRIMYTTYSGGAVPGAAVFHDELATPSFDPPGGPMQYLSQPFMDVADPMLLVGMAGIIGGIPIGPISFYWFSIAGPPGAPPVMSNQGSRRSHLLIPNHWDKCLDSDAILHRAANPGRDCCYPLIYYDVSGQIRAPKGAIPFRKVGTVPTPLAASGDVIVLDFEVPEGYDGLLSGLFNVYTGPGFAEGGGDIQWRIRVNKVYAVQLGQILVTLGSRQQSYPIEGGIQIQSGQHIQYIVNVPNLSGGILPLATQIVCGLEGLFYAQA